MAMELATLRIIKYPDPRLHEACAPVERFDDELAALAQRMLELMREDAGIGLAAPQVGVLRRMFVCNTTGEPGDDRIIVNPKATLAGGNIAGEEGCLSIPEVTVTVTRRQHCTLDALDVTGRSVRLTGTDLVARCWQHECDHLDGRLIIDQMPQADQIANRKALKRLESDFKRKASRF